MPCPATSSQFFKQDIWWWQVICTYTLPLGQCPVQYTDVIKTTNHKHTEGHDHCHIPNPSCICWASNSPVKTHFYSMLAIQLHLCFISSVTTGRPTSDCMIGNMVLTQQPSPCSYHSSVIWLWRNCSLRHRNFSSNTSIFMPIWTTTMLEKLSSPTSWYDYWQQYIYHPSTDGSWYCHWTLPSCTTS